jgi:hypothetical protein
MKQRVGILFTGNTRSNPLGFSKSPNGDILEGYKNNIFNNEFKEMFDYDIFISTDDIHIQNTISFFGFEHIKNIHILNSITGAEQYYLNDYLNYKIAPENYYLSNYLQQNFMDCIKYPNSILQNYKILDAYHLLQQYEEKYNVKYDYIVRIRLDLIFKFNIMSAFNKLIKNPNLQIIGHHDFVFIGKSDIMRFYCTSLNRSYGKYNFNETNHLFNNNLIGYNHYNEWKQIDSKRWTYAPEVQAWETLFEYCKLNNLDIDITINSMFLCEYVYH